MNKTLKPGGGAGLGHKDPSVVLYWNFSPKLNGMDVRPLLLMILTNSLYVGGENQSAPSGLNPLLPLILVNKQFRKSKHIPLIDRLTFPSYGILLVEGYCTPSH